MNYSIRKSSPVLLTKKIVQFIIVFVWIDRIQEKNDCVWRLIKCHWAYFTIHYQLYHVLYAFYLLSPPAFFGDASVRSSDTVGTRSAEIANDWSPWISKDNLAQCAFVFIGFRSDVVKHTKHAINHVNVRCSLVYQLWWMI